MFMTVREHAKVICRAKNERNMMQDYTRLFKLPVTWLAWQALSISLAQNIKNCYNCINIRQLWFKKKDCKQGWIFRTSAFMKGMMEKYTPYSFCLVMKLCFISIHSANSKNNRYWSAKIPHSSMEMECLYVLQFISVQQLLGSFSCPRP